MAASLNNFLRHYSCVAVFILSFISSMGMPAGSEAAIIGGGALARGEVHKLMSNGQPSSEYFHLSLALVFVLAVCGGYSATRSAAPTTACRRSSVTPPRSWPSSSSWPSPC
jgi:hypothetical protein